MTTPKFIPLAAGLQTELAQHLVQPGATLALENCTNPQTGKTQLRFGADILAAADQATLPPGGTLPLPWQLATLGGSLVRLNRAPEAIHTWAAGPERWIRATNDNGGIASYRKGPIKLDTSPVFSGTVAGDQVSDPTVAVAGDVIVEVYETFTASGAALGTAVVIMDRATRRPIYTRKTGSGTRTPKVAIVGTRAVVAYDSGGNLQVDSYNLTTFTIAQQQTMGALDGGTPIDIRVGAPVAGANNVAVLYLEDTTSFLRCAVLDATNLAVNSEFYPRTAAGAEVEADRGFAWLQDLAAQGDYSIVYANGTDGLITLWNLPAPAAGVSDATETQVLDATSMADLRNIIGSTTDALGNYRVLYEMVPSGADSSTRTVIKQVVWNALAPDPAPSADTTIRSVGIRSKLWLHSTNLYFLAAYSGFANRSYYVLAVPFSITLGTTAPAPLAVAFVRDAGGQTESDNSPSAAAVGDDGEIFIGVTSETRTESIATSGTAIGGTMRELAIELVRVRHADEAETEVGRPEEYLRSLFVPGGLLGFFDGTTYGAAGFAYPPMFAQYALTTPGGSLDPSAAYRYCYVYAFVDRNGRKWRSAPSVPDEFSTSGTHQQPALTIDTLRLVDRGLIASTGGGYQIEIYRTQANATEGFFLVATVANDPTADSVSMTDNVADDALGEQLYTDGGGVENQLLPSPTSVVEHQGRLVIAEAGTGTVWYSLEADFQSGPIFNEALTFDVGDPAEPITGLAVYNQSLFVFKAGKVYVVDGTGANALGQGNNYNPRLIDSGIGCSNPQSIAVADDGVWFRSSSARAGIHRTAGGVPEYVGGGVHQYDAGYTITGTAVVRNETQIRFYTLQGTTLVWDWTTRDWRVNTGQACLTAATGYEPVTGVVYATAGGVILSEATINSDDPWREGGVPYLGRIRSPWYQAAGIGGWERIKRIQGIGGMASNGSHTTTIRLYKNFSASPFQSATMSFSGSDADWDWELRPAQQKCTALMVEIEIGPYAPPVVVTSITPSDEPAVPIDAWAWFEADQGVTEALGVATAIDDLSGKARHATAAALSEPGYVTNSINGLPAIDFDIFDDERFENMAANIPAGERTVICVARPDGVIGGTLMAFRRTAGDWAAYMYEVGGSPPQFVWSDGAVNIQVTTPVDYSGAAHLFEHVQDAANNLTVRVDGVTVATTTDTTSDEDGDDGFVLGNRGPGGYTQGWVGQVGAWIVFARVLSSVDRAQLLLYLAKWGVSG